MRPTVERAHATLAWIATAGGALMLLGSLLKGESASFVGNNFGGPTNASQSFIARNAGGFIVLILGVAVAGLAVLLGLGLIPRWGAWIVAGLGAVGALVALLNLINIADEVSKLSTPGFTASVGPATPIALLGGLAAATLGILAAVVRPTPAAGTPGLPA